MSMHATALVVATILAAYPNAAVERSLDGQSLVVPQWSAELLSSTPKLRQPPAGFQAGQALVEVFDRNQCSEEDFSWASSDAEATPPHVDQQRDGVGRQAAGLRM